MTDRESEILFIAMYRAMAYQTSLGDSVTVCSILEAVRCRLSWACFDLSMNPYQISISNMLASADWPQLRSRPLPPPPRPLTPRLPPLRRMKSVRYSPRSFPLKNQSRYSFLSLFTLAISSISWFFLFLFLFFFRHFGSFQRLPGRSREQDLEANYKWQNL